jgi:hypothetical protein
MFTAKLNLARFAQRRFVSDPFNLVSLGLSFLINIIHWCLLYYKIKFEKGTILIHYNVIYGPDFIEKARFTYTIPLVALLFLIFNIGLSIYFYRHEKLAAYFLNFANIALQLIFFTASIIIVQTNG